jgi:hypothetical protein
LPKCEARRKQDGQPCQNLALRNGRCRLHGGKTPSGAGWHKPVWPDKGAPNAERKLQSKLRALERAAIKRAERLAKMTPEERARHEKWHRDHPKGSPAMRAAIRQQRRENEAARASLSQASSKAYEGDPEWQAIAGRIAVLKAALAEIENARAQAPGARCDDERTDKGVFG